MSVADSAQTVSQEDADFIVNKVRRGHRSQIAAPSPLLLGVLLPSDRGFSSTVFFSLVCGAVRWMASHRRVNLQGHSNNMFSFSFAGRRSLLHLRFSCV